LQPALPKNILWRVATTKRSLNAPFSSPVINGQTKQNYPPEGLDINSRF